MSSNRTGSPPTWLRRWGSIATTIAMLASMIGTSVALPPAPAAAAPIGQGFTLNVSDIRFIRQQIRIAEAHAASATAGNPCGTLLGSGANQVATPRLPYGLRTVDGTCNNLQPGQSEFGAADNLFPRMLTPTYRTAESGSAYTQKSGLVTDSQPRTVSNLVVDQSPANPAAVAASPNCLSATDCFIPNVAPDVGLSAPYNSLFTIFGQFFDHGLDLVTKGGSGAVFMPLKADDPLFVTGSPTNFMVMTRATNQPGPDGILGNSDDIQESTNTTTPFVDQNQTYTSHPSHQVFLRAYALSAGRPVATGKLIDGAIAGNIGNWSEVKAQAAALLGIALEDEDVFNVPLLATDAYGRFIPGPNGFPQVVFPGNVLTEGNPGAPISVVGSVKTGHAFLDDIAHNAAPGGGKTPDGDTSISTVPGSQPAGTYDDELLDIHFITGDGRGNENIALTAVHTIFHAEHNRLADDINSIIATLPAAEIADWQSVAPEAPAGSGWNYGERLFQAARFVTEMEYQHLVFEEFGRKVQPQINVFAGYDTSIDPSISAEFAHTVYRFGHSMLTEDVARIKPSGTTNDITLFNAFLNPLEFNENGSLTAAQAAGDIVRGMSQQVGNELDEFVTEALRNRLVGLPLDLAAINMARGRSEGIPSLNSARRQFFNRTGEPALAPYESWADFSFNLKHTQTVINLIAAYGTHPLITSLDPDNGGPITAGSLAARRAAADQLANGTVLPGPDGVVGDDPLTPLPADESLDDVQPPADSLDFMLGTGAWANSGGVTTTGVDLVDFWVGGLAEKQAPFGGLLGTTFNYVFETQLENLQDGDRFYYLTRTAGLNLLVQLEGNSFAELIMRNTDAEGLPADVFSRPDFLFNVANLGTSGAILDDASTPYNESTLLTRNIPTAGTIRFAGPEHVIWNGSANADRIYSSEGDDTIRGNDGNDWAEGGAGNDQFVGGNGNDILNDSFGDDVLKGGPGNDALSSGQGFDLNQGGTGDDFVVGGSDPTETFGGPGDDIVFAGGSFDTVFGDDGDDWIEGGGQADLLQGDNGAPFQNDPNQPGHDVIIGDGGDDDYDSEGGDDIMVAGPGIERNEGMLGFDWVTHRGDPQAANADLRITGLLPPDVETLRDRFDLTEGLSGWSFNDILRGDSRSDVVDPGAEGTLVGHELDAAGIARITGLAALLPVGATSFTGGNIIIGGAGSDILEGRGGNDILDGDRWLNVQLRAGTQFADSLQSFRTAVFAGTLDPGTIDIVRSIVTTGVQASDIDTAEFSGALAEYLITVNANGSITVDHQGGVDGVDTLWNIERLSFCDVPGPDQFTCATRSAPLAIAPAPTITTLSPSSATAGGAAFTLTVNGSNFVNGSSVVRWNGADRTTTFVNSTQLTASITAADIATAGTANVTVFTTAVGGGSSNTLSFTINAAPNPLPAITTINPTAVTAGNAGFTLTVNGTGFVNTSVVNIGGSPRTTTFVNSTQLTAAITQADIATAGTRSITVVSPTPGGGTSNTATLTVNAPPAPTITTLSPNTATVGGAAFTLTVNGTNFTASSVVNWNGSPRTTTFVNSTQLTAAITAADISGIGTRTVTVVTPGAPTGGGTSAGLTFTVNAAAGTPIATLSFEGGCLTGTDVACPTGADAVSGAGASIANVGLVAGSTRSALVNGTPFLTEDFTAVNSLFASFYFRLNAMPANDVRIFQIRNAGTTVGEIRLRRLSATQAALQLRQNGTQIGANSTVLVVGTVYRIGIQQTRGTGSNAILRGYLATGTGAYTQFAQTLTGTWTTQANQVRFGATNGVAINANFDDLKLDAAVLP